ncbi:MAG: hypothetical protein DIU54_009545 [Acidobacteriota bacterium]|nr:MAG: hypothetical protein DIU54_12680 [Acidobacteriota bacterium]
MNILSQDFAAGLFDRCEPPCLTLYQPTHRHHPERQQDRIRYRNLVRSLEASLRKLYPARDATPLLEPFHQLENDDAFWMRTRDGIAVLGARDMFRVYRLQRRVPELAIVADSCHTKPLIRQLQTTDRYQVMGLTRNGVRLFEGNRDVLDEIEPAPAVQAAVADAKNRQGLEPHLTISSYASGPGGQRAMFHGHGARELESDAEAERLFRAVDRAVMEHHSQPSGLPLILVSLPENAALFRRISRNPALLPDGVDLNPDALSLDELREHCWNALAPQYLARLKGLADAWTAARARERASEDLADIAHAIAASQVATLLIEADRHVPGRVDEQTGAIAYAAPGEPNVDDLLDDLGSFALRRGAEVVVMPSDLMPSRTGAAAIHRF